MSIINIIKKCCNYRQWTVSSPFRWAKHRKKDMKQSSKTVIVGITYALLQDDKALRRLFFDQIKIVNASLATQQGFIGSSFRLQPFGNEAWTLSVWENKTDMKQFVYGEPHLNAMKTASKAMMDAKTTHIELAAEQLPLSWHEALRLLHNQQ